MYHFNYVHYHLFDVICNNFIKMYTLVFDIQNFKDHQLMSQVASTENHSAFVLAAVNK